jgi:hypothetical protein
VSRGEGIEKPIVFGCLKTQHDDGLSKETTASSEFDHWTRPTNMQSLRISLQAQRHQRIMPESLVKLLKGNFQALPATSNLKPLAVCHSAKASV